MAEQAAPVYHDRMARTISGYTMWREEDGTEFRTAEEIADAVRSCLKHGLFDFDYVLKAVKADMRGNFAQGGSNGFGMLWEKTERTFVERVVELLENWQREGRV